MLCPEVSEPLKIYPLYRIPICIVPTKVGRWQNKSALGKYAILFDFSSSELPAAFSSKKVVFYLILIKKGSLNDFRTFEKRQNKNSSVIFVLDTKNHFFSVILERTYSIFIILGLDPRIYKQRFQYNGFSCLR